MLPPSASASPAGVHEVARAIDSAPAGSRY
jgi:hypothetical protein